MKSPADDPEFIQSLAKGLAVIEAFGSTRSPMTLSEIARATGLSPGSVRRILRTLQELGYADAEGRRFRLLPRALQLGYAYLASLPFATIVQPVLSDLSREVEGSCSVAVLDGLDVVYVARAWSNRSNYDYLTVGSHFPAHGMSTGKVLLAALPREELDRRLKSQKLDQLTPNTITSVDRLHAALDEVRARGWALNDQETAIGHRSIAAPITLDGKVTAALGIGRATQVEISTLVEDYLPKLRAAAAALSNLMASYEHSGNLNASLQGIGTPGRIGAQGTPRRRE